MFYFLIQSKYYKSPVYSHYSYVINQQQKIMNIFTELVNVGVVANLIHGENWLAIGGVILCSFGSVKNKIFIILLVNSHFVSREHDDNFKCT